MDGIRAQCPTCKSMLRIDESAIGKTKKCPQCKNPITIKKTLVDEKNESIEKESNPKKNGINFNFQMIGVLAVVTVMFVLFPLFLIFYKPPTPYVIPNDGNPWSYHVDTQSNRNLAAYRAKIVTAELFKNPDEVSFANDETVQRLYPLKDDEIYYRVLGTILLPNRLGAKKKDSYAWRTDIKYTRGKDDQPVKHISLIRVDNETLYMDENLKKMFSDLNKAIEESDQ